MNDRINPALTEPERRTLVALAEIQPATFKALADRAGYRSTAGVVDIVRRLRRRGLGTGRKRTVLAALGRVNNDSRSLCLADGVVVTGRGEIGLWTGMP